jgi:hypothetical protein
MDALFSLLRKENFETRPSTTLGTSREKRDAGRAGMFLMDTFLWASKEKYP